MNSKRKDFSGCYTGEEDDPNLGSSGTTYIHGFKKVGHRRLALKQRVVVKYLQILYIYKPRSKCIFTR